MQSPVIPAFVIARDRLTWLKALCADLVRMRLVPVIIDNESTYPPTVAWLKNCPYRVIPNKNCFPHDVFDKVVFKNLSDAQYYIVTDHDLDLSKVPDDAGEQLRISLDRNPTAVKAGLSLHFKDIPSDFPFRQSVIDNEKHHWERTTVYNEFVADTDTTLAIYRANYNPCHPGPSDPHFYKAVRLPPPYTARHLPWYQCGIFNDEELYYLEHAADYSQWTKKIKEYYLGKPAI